MMKMRRFLSLLSVMMLMLLVCMTAVSCSNNFKKVPQTGFVTHHVKNGDSHIPFDAYWNAPDEKAWNERVKGEHGKENLLAVGFRRHGAHGRAPGHSGRSGGLA